MKRTAEPYLLYLDELPGTATTSKWRKADERPVEMATQSGHSDTDCDLRPSTQFNDEAERPGRSTIVSTARKAEFTPASAGRTRDFFITIAE